MKVLVTGGCGFIGSHTIVDLMLHNFEVVCVDNFCRSNQIMLSSIEKIVQKKITNYAVDICDKTALMNIFKTEKNIEAIIHFAAYKAVEESVLQPLMYYQNNIVGLLNVLEICTQFNIAHFIFSSSCTVYGNPTIIPVTEKSAILPAASPYGASKQICEQILQDYTKVNPIHTILLRYFNPVGAHPSNFIGEFPIGKPQNLFPIITQTAIGIIPQMKVFGTDYNTKDGTCIRDYIHVCDIANAHTLALKYSIQQYKKNNTEIFNLGSGTGNTVLEVITCFEKTTHITLNYILSDRRPGDVEAIFANNEKAISLLHWQIKYNLQKMIETAWAWQLKIVADKL